ncbi:NTP transferase domain-containing protein [Nesterenkonia jeotgali]
MEKSLLRSDGQPQIQRWLQALEGRGIGTVVVGPASLRGEIGAAVPLVQEQPAYSGPAAGVVSGADELRRSGLAPGPDDDLADPADLPGWTLLLAVDLTEPTALLDWLLHQLPPVPQAPDADPGPESVAVLPCDATGRRQYLSAAVPTGWLLRRVEQLTPAQVENRPLRWLLQGLQEAALLRQPVVPDGLCADVDTLADAHRLGIRLPDQSGCPDQPDCETLEPVNEGAEMTAESTDPHEPIELWVKELAHHLEVDGIEIDIDAVLALAGQAAHTVVRPAAPVTTYLIGYVAGLAEATGQADFQTASRAASRVAAELLERRSGAVG